MSNLVSMNPKSYIGYVIPIILMVLGMTISCNEEYQYSHGNVYGVVTDATTGLPIDNCNVSISNTEGSIDDRQLSGSDGTYKTKDLSEGTYLISVEKEDYYAETSRMVEVKAGETTQCDIVLSRLPAKITSDTDNLTFGADDSMSTLSFKIVNRYLDDLAWVAEYDCDWISSIMPSEGTLSHGKTETIIVKIDRNKLSGGENKTNIVVKSRSGQGGVNVLVSAIGVTKESPVLNVVNVSLVDKTSAILSGEIVKPGVPEYTQRGFTCSLNSNDDNANELLAELNDQPSFTYSITGLIAGKKYYVRAFAVNESTGKVWSANEISFTTITSETVVQTLEVNEIDVSNGIAKFNGKISAVGEPPYSEKGFCFGTKSDPSVSDTKVTVSGIDVGEYSFIYAGLPQDGTYYVRAYAIQSGIINYGTAVTFNTCTSTTTVATSEATEITASSATLNGSISKTGNPEYSERGFCYSSSANPTINNTKVVVSGSGEGAFSANIDGLAHSKTYYYKAYAIQNGEAIYGEEISFTTDFSVAKVITSAATNVTSSSATLNGMVLDIGNPSFTEKGFCYSVFPGVTISDTKLAVEGVSAGNFSVDINGLSLNSTYYYKAYVIQEGDVIYGSEVQFSSGCTSSEIETHSNVTNITYDSAKLSFRIISLGDPKCTEAGICYCTSSNPSISSTVVSGNISTLKQTLTLSALQENTTYYFRAYVKQGGEYLYGTVYSFKTSTRPSVSTLDPTNLQDPYGLINMWQVQLNGRVNSVGDPKINSRGFKYSSYGDPETSGSNVSASGSSAGDFAATLSGLNSNTTYYVRAYVKNSLGYVYGELVTFTTGD